MLQAVRALCFDLDDTFWDVQRVLARAEGRVAEFLAQHYPRLASLDREQHRAARIELAREAPQRSHDLTWLRTEAMRRLARTAGYPDAVGEQAFAVFIEARNEVELFDDVLPALGRLRSRYVLATLSNGNADLARIGIAEHFTVRLSARDVGVAKPHRDAFAAVAHALGLAAGEVAYVGDDPHTDVAGARAAGLRTVWINRRGLPWPDAAGEPDLVVADLAELAQRVAPPPGVAAPPL
ncbi:MAG: HAD family hydrolase [Steroidobacteraceae bacterium]